MIAQLDPRYQRFLAVSILGLLVWIFFDWIALPLASGFQERSEEISDLRFQASQLQNINAQRERDLPFLLSLVEQADELSILLPEMNDQLATANLQERIGRITTRHAIEVSRNQELDITTDTGLKKVSIRLQARGTLDDLQAALYAIETARPYMFVDEIELNANETSSRQGQASMSIELTVSALMPHGSDP